MNKLPRYEDVPHELRTTMDIALVDAYNEALRLAPPSHIRAAPEPPLEAAKPPRRVHRKAA
jgi:hypothetical protein